MEGRVFVMAKAFMTNELGSWSACYEETRGQDSVVAMVKAMALAPRSLESFVCALRLCNGRYQRTGKIPHWSTVFKTVRS